MAKLVFNVTKNARADRNLYLKAKKEEEERKMYEGLTMAQRSSLKAQLEHMKSKQGEDGTNHERSFD